MAEGRPAGGNPALPAGRVVKMLAGAPGRMGLPAPETLLLEELKTVLPEESVPDAPPPPAEPDGANVPEYTGAPSSQPEPPTECTEAPSSQQEPAQECAEAPVSQPEPAAENTPAEPAETPHKRPVPLSDEEVTGHTASLWKYKPVPEEEPEPVPETLCINQTCPGGRVIAARVRGKKHKHEGTNCDDWYEAAAFDGLIFAAAADGAGSRKFSRIGARESCRAAVGFLRNRFEELWTQRPELAEAVTLDFQDPRCMDACGVLAGAVQQAVLKAREAVEAAFYARSLDPAYEAVLGRPLDLRDLSATLLVSAAIPAREQGRLVISCQVGDGMIALLDSQGPFEGAVKLMGAPDSGAFSGETEFLTSSKMASLEALQSRTKLSRGRSGLLLMMTDGVADDYFPGETELRRLYFDLIANGILESTPQTRALTPEQLRLYKRLSGPAAYPWVNDQSVQVPLHYTRRDLAAGLTAEELWQDRTALALAGLELEGLPEDPGERLLRWLDNYVERGSFDDRTLVAVQFS